MAAPCHATDLNAPATKKVTIGSEIQRGREAIFNQTLKADSTNLLGLADTINKVLDSEKQRNTDTDAFYLGAYFQAWTDMAIAIEANAEHPGFQTANTVQIANSWALSWFKKFRSLEKQLGVDDKTLTNLLEMKYAVIEPRIKEWSAKSESNQ